jgi:hypothetical protein
MYCESQIMYRRHYNRKCFAIGLVSGVAKSLRLYECEVRVSQRLKSLRGIRVRNCGFSETDFFLVCDDIWIAICPFFVVVFWGCIHRFVTEL